MIKEGALKIMDLLREFLRFEEFNAPELKKYKVKGFCLYPILRWKILTDLKEQNGISSKAHLSMKDTKNIRKKMFCSVFKSLKTIKNQKKKKCDFIMISNTRLRSKKNGNKYFDVIYDHLSSIQGIDNAMIMENSNSFTHQNPFTKNILYPEYFVLQDSIKAKCNVKFSNDTKMIQLILEFIKRKLMVENLKIIFDLQHYMFLTFYAIHHATSLIKLFQKKEPKLMVINTASYGGINAPLLKMAKELKIKTAEFQHGVIEKSNLVYNYPLPYLEKSVFQDYLPDYLLTFGDYWGEKTQTSSTIVSIGHPEFSKSIKKYSIDKQNTDKKKILIVSQGTITQQMVELAVMLSKNIDKNYQILYKLHPGEIEFEERYSKLKRYDNITIIKKGDIYKYISESDFIVGSYSLTLYEALGFKKKIFVYDLPISRENFDNNIGIWFNTAEELAKLLKESNDEQHNIDYEKYWKSDWEKNYKNFLENI